MRQALSLALKEVWVNHSVDQQHEDQAQDIKSAHNRMSSMLNKSAKTFEHNDKVDITSSPKNDL